eukprot:5810476-Alexandrium_andersonii.AAC.1
MSASLVGSEMCIRDSRKAAPGFGAARGYEGLKTQMPYWVLRRFWASTICLLYTSDAADDM